MSKWVGAIGILLVALGTCYSVWFVLETRSSEAWTYEWLAKQAECFRKQKVQVIIGLILVLVGSALQIVSLFL